MSILLSGTGSLPSRLGKLGAALNSMLVFLNGTDISAGGLKSLGVSTDLIQAQYASARQDLVSSLYGVRDALRSAPSGYLASLKGLCENTLVQMADDDAKLPSLTVAEAVRELKAQMIATSDSFPKPTVSAAVTPGGSNTGDGKLLASILGPDGLQLDYLFAETVRARCVTDAESGATAGRETFALQGAVAQPDTLAWNWPLGSGASTSLQAVDADQDADGANLLYNSGFTTFTTANSPDNWIKATGVIGTSILQGTGSNAYVGGSSLAFVGDGSELTSYEQPFNATPSATLGSGGTTSDLTPSTVYALSYWIKLSATAAAGVLEVALVDGSGTILTDAAGTDCKVTVTPTSQTSWTNVSGFIRTPAVLPSAYKLRVRLSTALTDTKILYIDHLAMAPAAQLYSGGPFFALFSGATDFVLDDSFSTAVANNHGSKWALLLERVFGLRALGMSLPSSGSPTIADSLVA